MFPLAAKWTVDIPAPPVADGVPVSDGEHVYLALLTGQIIARASADGAEVWQRDLATERPLAADGGLLFVAGTDAVHALRGTDGALAWEAPVPPVTAPLLARGGWLIVLSGGKVIAFRGADGTLVWQRAIGAATVRPAMDGDRLYITETDGTVLALNVTSGNPLWEQRLHGPLTEPLAWFGYVYIGGGDRQFYCLRAKNGEIGWRWRIGAAFDVRSSADDARVYFVGLDNVLRALDRVTGVQQWQAGLKRRPVGGPVVMQDWLLVPSSSSPEIWAWTTSDGRAAGVVPTPADPSVEPEFVVSTTDGGQVYVVTGSLARVWQLTLVATAGDPPAVALDVMPGELMTIPGTRVSLELPPQ